MNLKPSIYNYYFNIDNNKTGVFNSFSKALLVLEHAEYECLLHDNGLLPVDVREALLKNGILIASTVNEHEKVNIVRTEAIQRAIKSVYRIFTTTDCNARCFYCYEENAKPVYMSEKTANNVAQFIIEHVGQRPCLIQWFGGEPLLNMSAIDIITAKLREELGDGKVSFMMITNGSLITEEIVKKMVYSWNIKRIQISLDGASDEYICRKNYVSLKDPFTIVLKNIKLLLEQGIFVNLRINYDRENYEHIPELIHILSHNFKNFSNLHVYTYHIFQTKQKKEEDPLAEEEWFAMQEELINAGFLDPMEAYSLTVRNTQCFACSSRSFVITPDGLLYKCALATNNKSASVGNIEEGIVNYALFEKWCDPSLRDECASCVFLPLCQGGCRAGVFDYISEKCFAQKDFADKVLKKRLMYLNPKT